MVQNPYHDEAARHPTEKLVGMLRSVERTIQAVNSVREQGVISQRKAKREIRDLEPMAEAIRAELEKRNAA